MAAHNFSLDQTPPPFFFYIGLAHIQTQKSYCGPPSQQKILWNPVIGNHNYDYEYFITYMYRLECFEQRLDLHVRLHVLFH